MPIRSLGLSFEAPILASVDPRALALSVAAAAAIFRFNVGMLQTLGACAVAGLFLHVAGAL
jgi:chromate transporter